jgi:putative toxin-antitoxin system antitoxin component (TIGR02293 family)
MKVPDDIWQMLERIDDYRGRVRRGVLSGNYRSLSADLAEFEGIVRRLYQRLFSKKVPFMIEDNLMQAAMKTFGSRENAKEWFENPALAFGWKRPIDILDTEGGDAKILDVLGALEHGNFL